MKTQEEIVERINERKRGDPFRFEIDEYDEYLQCLNFQNAKIFLTDKVNENQWDCKPISDEELEAKMLDYMPFAWGKAIDGKGISAVRSIQHFIAWIWLLGEDDFAKEIDSDLNNNWRKYGQDILIKICEHFNWNWKKWAS